MEEQWKDIKGYEGLYEISDLGRVRNAKNGMIRKLVGHRYQTSVHLITVKKFSQGCLHQQK